MRAEGRETGICISWLTFEVSHDRGWRGVCVCTIRDSHGRCAVAPGSAYSFFSISILVLKKLFIVIGSIPRNTFVSFGFLRTPHSIDCNARNARTP